MRMLPALVALALLAPLSTAQDPEPAKPTLPPEVVEANELIHAGEIAAALAKFQAYDQAVPGNKYSAKAIRPLTQALQLEKIIQQGGDNAKFAKAADWLQSFYTVNSVPSGILPLAEKAWQQLPDDATWGTRYATALADAGQPQKALGVYVKLLDKQGTPGIHAKVAVLLARDQKTDEAHKHLGAIPADITCADTTLDAARAHASLGELELAAGALQRSFELTPPSQLAQRKKLALSDPDLAALQGTELLAKAQAAESKVPEPTGSACDTCPSSSSCGKSGSNEGREGDQAKKTPPVGG
jgi:tetratricopeptide (TPR) repeat protein